MELGVADSDSALLQEDMIRITDRLPAEVEYRSIRHLILQSPSEKISDDHLAHVLASCPHLETVILSGVPDTTDRTIVLLAENALNLQGLNLSGCTQVTDVGVLDVTNKSPPLQWLQLNGVVGLTDPTISAIAKTCSRLIELELCDLPLLTPVSVRDIWSFSRKLRTLRLARCPLLTDKAFPAPLTSSAPPVDPDGEKPLPHRPITWLEGLPPLILHHSADNLRLLDLTTCKNLTDEAVEGIVTHAPKIQTLILAGCSQLTDRAIESICKLGDHLDTLILAHVANITDRSIVRLTRSCPNIRCIDVAFCRHLTDLAVIELASLNSLRRLSLMRVHKLTDNAVFALAEHAAGLERLHLSYCDCLSLDALHLLLKRLENLQHFVATGVRSFIKRKGIERFSEVPPPNSDADQQGAFRVFAGENIGRLRQFLDKEEKRKREAEARSIPFIPRSDDSMELY